MAFSAQNRLYCAFKKYVSGKKLKLMIKLEKLVRKVKPLLLIHFASHVSVCCLPYIKNTSCIMYRKPAADPPGSLAGSQLYMICWHLSLALTLSYP